MSAFGTAKKGSALGVQLQFPEVAAAARVATHNTDHGYAPRFSVSHEAPPVGEDLQDDYHAQKYKDAVHMANAKVAATKKALWLWTHDAVGITQPKAVLGQRKFANPSNGNQVDIYSARRTMSGGEAPIRCTANGLQGGVLRTAEGQKFGHQLLMGRVKQLDTIDDAEGAFAADAPTPAPEKLETVEKEQTSGMIDLANALNEIRAIFLDNNALTLDKRLQQGLAKSMASALKLLLKYGPTFDKDDLDDVKNAIDSINDRLRSVEADRLNDADAQGATFINYARAATNMLAYVNGMYKGVNKDLKSRQLLSRSLIKSLKLTSAARFAPTGEDVERAKTEPVTQPYDEGYPEVNPNKEYDPEAARRQQGAGKHNKKQWIQNVVEHMKKGAFSKQAKAHHETTKQFAKEVVKHPEEFAPKTRKRAVLAQTLGAVRKGGAQFKPKDFNASAKFDVDQRVRYGDQAGAYYGEAIGQRVATEQVPIPVEPDGTYIYPDSGAVRPIFPKINKPKAPKTNEMKPRREAPLPVFQDSASGIFSAPRQKIPTAHLTEKPKEFAYGGKKLTRAMLPKTLEGFKALAEELKHHGHNIRVGSGKLTNIRLNFIKRLLI